MPVPAPEVLAYSGFSSGWEESVDEVFVLQFGQEVQGSPSNSIHSKFSI